MREGCRQPCGRRHLQAEVHHLPGAHAFPQRVQQRHQLGALGLGGQHPQQPLAGAPVTLVAARRQGVHQPFQLEVGVAELAGVHQVLGELTPQPQHHRGDRRRGLVGAQLAAVSGDHIERQLPQLGLAEQPGVRFHGEQRAVLTQQRAGEGMIGADHRGARGVAAGKAVGVPPACGGADAGQSGQPGPNAPQQLAGGLAGERQTQHLAGFGVAVGDQPHHPRGHRLRFAGSGSRDDHQRARRRANDRGLLLGGREKS